MGAQITQITRHLLTVPVAINMGYMKNITCMHTLAAPYDSSSIPPGVLGQASTQNGAIL